MYLRILLYFSSGSYQPLPFKIGVYLRIVRSTPRQEVYPADDVRKFFDDSRFVDFDAQKYVLHAETLDY